MLKGKDQPQLLPFAYGTSKKYVNVGTVAYANGATSQIKLPKSGFLSSVELAFNGTATVGTAGASGSPSPWNLIANYSLTANLGFQYRSLSGDRLYFRNQLQNGGSNDPVTASKTFKNYNPTSASAQTVAFVLTDLISLNRGLNFDKYMISCQTLDQDTYISLTFGAPSAIVANTEVITSVTGNFVITAEFYTVPDTSKFALPDTSIVQQIIEDASYTSVVASDNMINLTPIQGPEYTTLAFKVTVNSVPDSADYASQVSRVRIFANATDPIYDLTGQQLLQMQFDHYGRALPAGWFVLNFLDDISLVNAVGPVERLALSTQAYSQLTLDVTLTGSVSGSSSIVLLKRMQSEVAA